MLAAGLALAGCSDDGGGPDVSSLKVTGADQVHGGRSVRMSPDGSRLMLLDDGELCAAALDGSGKRCVDSGKAHPDARHAQWSPDGTKIVFTDDYQKLYREPDVWVFDVTSGELHDLTEDGVAELSPGDDTRHGWLDVFPSWTIDGDAIRFARPGDGDDSVDLMSIDPEGGDPTTLRSVGCAAAQLSALAFTDDHAAWTCGIEGGEVRVADLEDGQERTVLSKHEADDQSLLAFSPDGSQLLIDSMVQYSGYQGAPGGGLARIVPVDGDGEARPVADGKVAYPTWAPEGAAIAYVDAPGSVKVVAEPDGEPRKLRDGKHVAAPDGVRLEWVPGKLLVNVEGKPTVLNLGDSGS